MSNPTRTLGILLFPDFELLDVCGPAEMFGKLEGKIRLVMVAEEADAVPSRQGPKLVADFSLADAPPLDLLLAPGGLGVDVQCENPPLLQWLRQRAASAEIVMSVCTGSALLAAAGLLDGRRATSNKRRFHLAVSHGPRVEWVREARFVDDGDRVTSSGVSAGIDMALHVIARLYGQETAQHVADTAEYPWTDAQRNGEVDPFIRFLG
jgi:transcriptional regulator GlxA family with amidase domain